MSYTSALQDTLAAEHAALFVYGVLAGQTSRLETAALFGSLDAAYAAHRDRRDQLEVRLRALGVEPVAALPAYAVPTALGRASAVAGRARALERDCAAAYAWLVQSSPSAQRRWAVEALTQTAVRELVFRGAPEMLPGSDEYADR